MKKIILARSSRAYALREVESSPDGYVLTIAEPTRSLDQNAFLHAMLSDIAGQLKWAGSEHDVETWKRLLVAAWMRATGRQVTLLPALDGQGFDALYQRTSRLSKSECSELCEYILSWGTEQGVEWSQEMAA